MGWARRVVRHHLHDLARRYRDPARLIGALLVAIAWGLAVACLWVRGSASGSDASAYWHAARWSLVGGDPYDPSGPWLPYAYAPWLLPSFLPMALLPWQVAWPVWRLALILVTGATVVWAWSRRPLATGIASAVLMLPLALSLDSGNVVIVCVGAVWAAQLARPRLGGLLWAFATAMKWYPAIFLAALTPQTRRWGLVFAGVGIAMTVATWPWTLEQIRVVLLLGVPGTSSLDRIRIDHAAILWGAIPWLYRSALPGLEARIASRRGAVASGAFARVAEGG